MFRKQILTTAMISTLFLLSGCHQNPAVKQDNADAPKLTRAEAEIEKQAELLSQLLLKPNAKEIGEEALKIGEKLDDDTDMIHTIKKYQVEAFAYAKAAVVAESVSPDKPDKIIYADKAIEAARRSLLLIYDELEQTGAKLYKIQWNPSDQDRKLLQAEEEKIKNNRKTYQWIISKGRRIMSHIILAACFSVKARSGDEKAFEEVRANVESVRWSELSQKYLAEMKLYFPMSCYLSFGGKLYPIDEAKNDPSFLEFRNNLLKVVKERKGFESIKPFIDTNIFASDPYDDSPHTGIEAFKNRWMRNETDSELWNTLTKILQMGGVFINDGINIYFKAPYVEDYWSGNGNYLAMGDSVEVRAKPDPNSEVIMKLSYDIVTVEMCDGCSEWIRIIAPDCREGYIHKSSLYRRGSSGIAIFGKENGKWTIKSLEEGMPEQCCAREMQFWGKDEYERASYYPPPD